jgi:hypothetical protein
MKPSLIFMEEVLTNRTLEHNILLASPAHESEHCSLISNFSVAEM